MTENGNKPILRRTFTVPLEAKEGRLLEGCVVPYGEASKVSDGGGPAYWEEFLPGAFSKQLSAANRIELRYEHRDGLADSVGLCRSLSEEAHGLFGAFAVHNGAFGDQALELVRAGILPGFSIEFSDDWSHPKRRADGTVERHRCTLHTVGLVRQPAHQGALVMAIRSRQELLGDIVIPGVDEEQLERLRAVGVAV
jgi:HK97 family phage prohead protease